MKARRVSGGNPDERRSRSRTAVAALAVVTTAIGVAGIVVILRGESPRIADPDDPQQVTRGRLIYDQECASCHGEKLEGQPNWRQRLPSGRLPAPPHDDTGHTWHHPTDILFHITKFGLVPPHAPADYQSDMPAFGESLTDQQILDALAYIKSGWSPTVRDRHLLLDKKVR